MNDLEKEIARLKRKCADKSVQLDLLKEALVEKAPRPSRRRELAKEAVSTGRANVSQACRAFSISETCYRFEPKPNEENEMIARKLRGLKEANPSWGFRRCFLHLRNVEGHGWNQKRVYRIYRKEGLNLLIKRGRRIEPA